MSDVGFTWGYQLYRAHAEAMSSDAEPAAGAEVDLLGRIWEVLPGVFSPTRTPATRLFSRWIPYPAGGSFLEVGCGTGVIAVTAALSGCREVTALDISVAAVENTRRNARRHGVADLVHVMQSDLFAALPAGARFDMIFWNSNFAEPPDCFVNETDLHHAFFDPGYRAHHRYVREGPTYLNDGGKLLLGFSSIGNARRLGELCAESRLTVHQLASERRELGITIVYELLELRPVGKAVDRSRRRSV